MSRAVVLFAALLIVFSCSNDGAQETGKSATSESSDRDQPTVEIARSAFEGGVREFINPSRRAAFNSLRLVGFERLDGRQTNSGYAMLFAAEMEVTEPLCPDKLQEDTLEWGSDVPGLMGEWVVYYPEEPGNCLGHHYSGYPRPADPGHRFVLTGMMLFEKWESGWRAVPPVLHSVEGYSY